MTEFKTDAASIKVGGEDVSSPPTFGRYAVATAPEGIYRPSTPDPTASRHERVVRVGKLCFAIISNYGPEAYEPSRWLPGTTFIRTTEREVTISFNGGGDGVTSAVEEVVEKKSSLSLTDGDAMIISLALETAASEVIPQLEKPERVKVSRERILEVLSRFEKAVAGTSPPPLPPPSPEDLEVILSALQFTDERARAGTQSEAIRARDAKRRFRIWVRDVTRDVPL